MPVKRKTTEKPDFTSTNVFSAFVRKTIADFPKMKDKFVFYNLPGNSWHNDLKDPHGVNARTARAILKEVTHRLHQKREAVAFGAYTSDDYFMMAFIGGTQGHRYLTSLADPPEREIFSILSHELGHLVAPAGTKGTSSGHGENFYECVADTFSFIRQMQEYKTLQPALDATKWRNAFQLALSAQSANYTVPVLIVLENLAQKHDLSTLTPTETANLAYRISRYAAPDAGQLAQLEKIFAPVQSQYMQEPLEESLRHLAEIMHDDHGALSSAVAMTGRLALSPFLEGQTDVIRTKFPSGRHPLLEGRFWDTVRAQFAARPDSKIMSLDKTALDLQLLGRFDKNPGAPIDPAQYETSEYQTYLHEARETHMTAQIKKRKSPVTRIM